MRVLVCNLTRYLYYRDTFMIERDNGLERRKIIHVS